MKSLIRNIVAGPKKKTPYNGQQLDLTYITDRVIAMAYPASNFLQKAYRNSITDVANYLEQYHKNNYLIINVSSRPYDYAKFNNQVLEYEWPDHQAPPITTLFEIAYRAFQYFKSSPEGVIAVHCNHGKGRTGTAIISILLYLGIYKNAQEALTFYNSRRFSSQTYGVDQPCQTRYLNFVQQILLRNKIPERLIAFRLCNVSATGLHQKHFISVKQVRNNQNLVQKFNFAFDKDITGSPLMGDLFIEIFEEAWPTSKQIARINYNTYFLDPDTQLSIQSLKKDAIQVLFKGTEISSKKSAEQKFFSLTLHFEYFCLCHIQDSEGVECQCQSFRYREQKYWRKMIEQKVTAQVVTSKDRAIFFSLPFQQIQKQIKQEQVQKVQTAYSLGRNMSNLNFQQQLINKIKDKQRQVQQLQKIQIKREGVKQEPNSSPHKKSFSDYKDNKQ